MYHFFVFATFVLLGTALPTSDHEVIHASSDQLFVGFLGLLFGILLMTYAASVCASGEKKPTPAPPPRKTSPQPPPRHAATNSTYLEPTADGRPPVDVNKGVYLEPGAESNNLPPPAIPSVQVVPDDEPPVIPTRKVYTDHSISSQTSSPNFSRQPSDANSTLGVSQTSGPKLPQKYHLVSLGQSVPSSANEESTRKAMVSVSAEVSVKDVLADLERWQLQRNQFELLDQLGKGHFGEVYRVRVSVGNSVCLGAAKTLQLQGEMGVADQRQFLIEAQIMKEFKHDHVLQLLGIRAVIDEEPWYMLTELCELGDLRNLLKEVKVKEMSLLEHEKIHLCLQISSGMGFLASKQFIHRDLAARNCFVTVDGCVKIGDFGMSRLVLQEDDYYRANEDAMLPFRWMAIESMLDQRFTLKSDVWSFGILMLEIFSYGATPFTGMNNMIVVAEVEKGHRPKQPYRCPDEVYSMMSKCWSTNPNERPNFRQLYDHLLLCFRNSSTLQPPVRDMGQVLCSVMNVASDADVAPYSKLGDHKMNTDEGDYTDLSGNHQVYHHVSIIDKIPPAPPAPEQTEDSAPYLHGVMSRAAAERVLLSQGRVSALEGSFLIRKSPTTQGYSLSVIFEGQVWHYKIRTQHDGMYVFYGTEFPSLDSLVEYHQKQAGKLMKPLTNPADAFV